MPATVIPVGYVNQLLLGPVYGQNACVNICFETTYQFLNADLLNSRDLTQAAERDQIVLSYRSAMETGILLHQAYCSVQPAMSFHQEKDVTTIFGFDFRKDLVPITSAMAAGKYNRGESFKYNQVLAPARIHLGSNQVTLAHIKDAEDWFKQRCRKRL